MLAISPDVSAAFAAKRIPEVALQMAEVIATANPDLVATMPRDELNRRSLAGTQVSDHYGLQSARDIMLLCLAHAIFGQDMLSRPGFEWVAPLLQEPVEGPDTRAYRLHLRLSELG